MALYGVDIRTGNAHNNEIGFTGWTPTLGRGATQPQYGSGTTAGSVQMNGQSQNDDRIAKQFRKSGMGNKILRQVFNQLIGVAVGGNTGATLGYKQVRGQTGDNYTSLRQIDNLTFATRTLTAADQAAFRGMVTRLTAPAVYAADVSRNGGGGKVKF